MNNLENISETLDTEIKSWLDPREADDQARIAKACIALRNHGGGSLIIGFDDGTLKPLGYELDVGVREAFHFDRIQECVVKFAKPPFEVEVQFLKNGDQEHPVIKVQTGVTFPVIVKSSHSKIFSRQNAVITRTLSSNNRVSSAEPQTPEDWNRLIRTCFDNREADIGRFFRRHISGIQQEIHADSSEFGQSIAVKLLDENHKSFIERIGDWSEKYGFQTPATHGFRECAFWIEGDFEREQPKHLLDKIFPHQPRLTGWPPFVDSRNIRHEWCKPYVTNGAWEALVYIPNHHYQDFHLDFWHVDGEGKFYHARVYEDDTYQSQPPAHRRFAAGQFMDFVLLISRTTELLAVALAFGKALASDESSTSIHFAFKWTGLEDREICSWVEPLRDLWQHRSAVDDEVVTEVSLALDFPATRLWETVKQVTQPVFDVFASGVADSIYKEIVNRTLRQP